MSSEFKALIGLELNTADLASIKNTINDIGKTPINLKLNIDSSSLNNINKQIQNSISFNSSNTIPTATKTSKTYTVKSKNNYAIANLNVRKNSLLRDIERLQKQINLSELDFSFGTSYSKELDKISSAIGRADKFDFQNLRTKFADLKKDISFDSKKYSLFSELEKLEKSYLFKDIDDTFNNAFDAQIHNKTKELSDLASQFDTLRNSVRNAIDVESFDKVNRQMQFFKSSIKDASSELAILDQRKKLSTDIGNYLTEKGMFFRHGSDGKTLSDYKSDLDNLSKSIDSVSLAHMNQEFSNMKKTLGDGGNTIQQFSSKVGELFKYLNSLFLAQVAFDSITKMFDEVKNVDKSMTELYRVTDLSSTKYSMLYDDMVNSAKEYGSTLSDIISSTAAWARLGFSADESVGLAEVTSMYQHIADIDYSTAVENLITAYKGFQPQLQQMFGKDSVSAVEYIADIYNELGNKYAIDSEEVGAALQRSASTLSLAGNTIQESAGMATGMSEVIQDPEKAGNALKILSMRLRGMKGELQELGEDVDENVESISKMQTQVLNLTHGKVNIFDKNGDFKSTYKIMEGISSVYSTLSDTEQADLLETIAGKNRANEIAALISNWSQVEKATESAMNAQGSASEEYEIYADGIEGRTKRLSAAFSDLSNDFIKSGFVKVAVSGFTSLTEIIDGLVKNVGTLGTVGIGTVITNIIKNFRNIKKLMSSIKGVGFKDTFSKYSSNISGWVKSVSGITTIAGVAATAIGALYSAYSNYKQKQRETWQTGIDKSTKSRENLDNVQSLYSDYYTARNSYDGTAESKANLTSATTSLLTALGMESTEIDNLISKYGVYSDKINETAESGIENTLKEHLTEVQGGWNSAASALLDDFNSFFSQTHISAGAYRSQKEIDMMHQIIDDTGLYEHFNSKLGFNGISIFDGEIKSAEDAVVAVENLKKVKKWFEDKEASGEISQEDLTSNDIYNNTNKLLSKVYDNYEEYIKQNEDLKKTLAEISMYDALENLPKDFTLDSAGDYIAYRKMVAQELVSNNLFTGNEQDAMDIIDSLASSGTIEDVTNGFQAFADAEAEVAAAAEEMTIDDKINSVKESLSDNSLDLNQQVENNKVSQWIDTLSDEEKDFVYRISISADDTSLWTLTKWQEELLAFKNTGMTTEQSWGQFLSIMNNTEDGNFSDSISNSVSKLGELKEAFLDVKNGSMEEQGLYDLAFKFPELAPYINDTDALKNEISSLMDATNSDIISQFDTQIEAVGGSSTIAGQALESLKSKAIELSSISFSDIFNIDDFTTEFNNFYSAVKNSVTGTGLTTSDIKNVDTMFSSLDGYDKSALFERTANGIHLNIQELRNLQNQYEESNKAEFDSTLNSLIQEYNQAKEELSGLTTGTEEYDAKLSEINSLESQIDEVATLASQYEGLTSAYNKWIQAQSTENEGAMYEKVRDNISNAQEQYDSGKTNTDDFISYINLISGANVTNGADAAEQWEKLHKTIQGTQYTVMDFYDEGSNGALNFLNAVNQLNSDWAHMNEDGEWIIDFGVGGDQDVADALGMNVEQVQAILRELSEYGFVINLDSKYSTEALNNLELECYKADETLRKIGEEPVEIDIHTDNVDSEIEHATSLIDEIKNSDIDPDVKTAKLQDANSKLDYLIDKKQQASQPSFMSIDVSNLDGGMQTAISLLQQYQSAVDNLEELKIKGVEGKDLADAQSKVAALAKQIQSLPDNVKIALGIDPKDDIETIKQKIANDDLNIDVNADVSDVNSEIDSLDGKNVTTNVNANVNGKEKVEALATPVTKVVNVVTSSIKDIWNNSTAIQPVAETKTVTVKTNVVGQDAVKNLTSSIKNVPNKTANVTTRVNGQNSVTNLSSTIRRIPQSTISTVSAIVNGYTYVQNLLNDINKLPANKTVNITVNQTNNNFVGPTKSVANGTANVNGTAITGRSFSKGNWGIKGSGIALVGELGQELLVRDGKYYTLGDYSAEFVKYKEGDIIFNARQTKELLSKGKITTSRKRGYAFSNGSGSLGGGSSSGGTGGNSGGSSGNSGNSGGSSSGSSGSSETTKEFKETIDWIEIAIDRIERIINRLKLKAESIYSLWSERNKNLVNEISKVREEIDLQQRAYNRYLQEANSVGLSDTYAQKVKDGTIDIEKITDEDLYDKIQEYQQWYEKALDCLDAIDQLKETESELYKTAFDNISTQYDAIITELDNRKSLIEEYVSQFENKGYITTTKFYEKLIETEKDNISKLEEERDQLQNAMDNAVNSGTILEGSEAWYEMKNSIDEVTVSIEESKTSMLDYANSIRQVKWDTFDMILDRMSKISDEADNLIDLFSEMELFEDTGALTSEGMSSMGLHGLNYNVYMEQAKKYADEIETIQKELAQNPYDKELIERKSELLELHREMILAAKEERSAIVDLVEQGIQKELEHLQNLIDKYNEALDSEKDLYDYQKKIKSQTETITSIEKQLLAYQNDDSEETRLKVQELKNSLSEEKENLKDMEYERYISDQKELLNDLYSEYEEVLNSRLDNVDQLVSDMINMINENSSIIKDSIDGISEKLGIVISNDMLSVWSENNIQDSLKYYDYQKQNSDTTRIVDITEKIYNSIENMTNNLSNISDSILNGTTSITDKDKIEGMIVRSNGDVLIPLDESGIFVGSSVFADGYHADISNLYGANFATKDVPSNSTNGYATINNNDLSVEVVLPNVKNYNDLKKEMQKDKNFEYMIRAMTTDRIFGGSSLKKYKT